MRPPRVVAYVGLVVGLAVAALSALSGQHIEDHWSGTFLLATLVALAGATPVRIPGLKSAVSATDPFVFTALAAYGPMPACVVAMAGVLGSTLGRSGHRQPLPTAFNFGNVVFSTGLASAGYLLVGGVAGSPLAGQVWPLVFATTIYFVTNTGLVTGAIFLETGQEYLATWRASGLWMAVSTYAGLPIAAGLLYLLESVGPSGLALGVPPCWLLAAFYRSHKQRQEEQQRRIVQIEEVNHELEDKVAERTGDLRRALNHIERVNTRLRTTNDRLTKANLAKNEFLANVSHELRTPLNAIIGFSDLLREGSTGELNEQQQDFLHDIQESGEHLLRLINGILDLSKMEAGKMEIHRERIDAVQVARDTVAMVHPQAAAKKLRLEVDCPDDESVVLLDPGMFRQILINLLANAVKFTPEGGEVRVAVRYVNSDVNLEVADSGIGIATADIEHVFDEFFQVDSSYSRTYGGTGLGLALVRKMVEMHNGRIEVESELGEGTRFLIRFPGALADEVAEAVAGKAPPAPRPTESTAPPPPSAEAKYMILVVEDNPVNRKLARNVLRARGHLVREAATGEEALRTLKLERPDLILMDIQLPGLDGLEVTRRIKQDPALAVVPIVALTAHARDVDEQRALEAGCVGYITKPIRLAQFPSQVETYLTSTAALTS